MNAELALCKRAGAGRFRLCRMRWPTAPVPKPERASRCHGIGIGFGFGIPPPLHPNSQPQQPGAATVAPAVARGAVAGTPTRPVRGCGCPTGRGRGTLALPVAGGASFDASTNNLDLPNPPPTAPQHPQHPENAHGGPVFAGTHAQNRQKMRESAASARSGAPCFALHTMIYSATTAQIWHEIQRQPATTTATVVFRLQKDPSSTPYRYRGVPNFSVTASMSWFVGEIAIVDDYGRPWLPNWMQFAAALPELLAPGVSVGVQVDADAVAWAPSASRTTKRVVALTTTKAAWPGRIEELRAEWLPRRKTDRRTGYLAAADALQGAIEFDQARGAA